MVPRAEHNISRKLISDNALKVLRRLNKSGFDAYLVGGSVRDLLLGEKPKDFDITTNATPEQVRQLFRNCRLIGRRFRLAHIMFGPEVIEVATFRGHHEPLDTPSRSQTAHGLLLNDNVYGTIEEDAHRRDFTINSLYYSTADFTLRDYTGGLSDLKRQVIRLIGDPETRYREDPVRMLRAIRFATKLGMVIDPATAEPIPRLASLLRAIPPPRLFEESLKLLQSGQGYATYQKLRQYQLIDPLFPIVSRHFTQQNDSNMEHMLDQVLQNTDHRLKTGLSVNPAFLFAAILWYPLTEQAQKISIESGLPHSDAFLLAMSDILNEQCQTVSIPKRLTILMRDIWQLQSRLSRRHGKRAHLLMQQPKFRAAYDLLVLRADIERKKDITQLAQWWETFQNATPIEQSKMLSLLNTQQTKRYRRPRRPAHSTSAPTAKSESA